MIVVDVGSAEHGREESVHRLVSQYGPSMLFGFDPLNDWAGVVNWMGTPVVLSKMAAWLFDGVVGFQMSGITSGIPGDGPRFPEPLPAVPCFDLANFLAVLISAGPVILKLDCEGAEYPLLRHLRAQDIDTRLNRVLVEWHDGSDVNGDFYAHGWDVDGRIRLRCPVEEW